MNTAFRKYGNPPFNTLVLHGGPGAPGDVASLVKKLSESISVIEPFQTKDSIEGQYKELEKLIREHAQTPIHLIGHSWGAWLAFIFTARNPQMVKKLIMISSGPLEEKYALDLMDKRLSRLSEEEEYEVRYIEKLIAEKKTKNKEELFARFGELMSKADSFEEMKHENEVLEYQFELSQKIWREASAMRRDGKLLDLGMHISCPVVAIHGDYDTHPSEGVRVPLGMVVPDFRFHLIEKCGHYPWFERHARERFFEILLHELSV